jgi:hypothetical protein
MRTFLAALLATVAIVLVPFADLGVWIEREVVGTTSFVRLGEQVIDQPAARTALAEQIAADLTSRVPSLARREPNLQALIADVLARPALRPPLDDALTSTHEQLRSGHDPLQLDVTPLVGSVRAQLPPQLAVNVPAGLTVTPVTVLRRQDAPAIWDGVQLVQDAALVVPIVALLAFVGALLAARRRGGLCIAVGVIMTITSLGLLALVKPGRSLLEQQSGTPAQHSAFLAGYDTVLRSFEQQTVVFAVLGGVLALVGIALVWQRGRNVRPRGWA